MTQFVHFLFILPTFLYLRLLLWKKIRCENTLREVYVFLLLSQFNSIVNTVPWCKINNSTKKMRATTTMINWFRVLVCVPATSYISCYFNFPFAQLVSMENRIELYAEPIKLEWCVRIRTARFRLHIHTLRAAKVSRSEQEIELPDTYVRKLSGSNLIIRMLPTGIATGDDRAEENFHSFYVLRGNN